METPEKMNETDSTDAERCHRELASLSYKERLAKELEWTRPNQGELWRTTFEEHVAIAFWSESGHKSPPGRYHTVRGGEIVLILGAYLVDIGAGERGRFIWKIRILVGDKVYNREYGSLLLWHEDFERVA